jgi:hypothetical protein
VDQSQVDDYLAEAREALGDDVFRQTWQRGQELTLEEAVAIALQDP